MLNRCMRACGGKQGRATHAGISPYAAFVTMRAASPLDHNSLFPWCDVVEERLIHVDDDCRLAAKTVTQNVSDLTEKDCSTVFYVDLGNTMRHLVAAPLKAPPVPEIPAPSLGGLRICQMGDERRMGGRPRQVLGTPQSVEELEMRAPATRPGSNGARLRPRSFQPEKPAPAAARDPWDSPGTVPRVPGLRPWTTHSNGAPSE